jgi:hypothetical protein
MKRLFVLPLLVAASLSLASCRSESPAIEVNGVEISIEDFDAELQQLANNPFLRENRPDLFAGDCGEGSDATNQPCRLLDTTVAKGASNRVLVMLFRAEFADRGLAVTDEARAELVATYPEGFLDGFSEEFADTWVENDLVFETVVGSLDSSDPTVDPAATLQRELVTAADVAIDPRYGSWNPEAGVEVPELIVDLRLRNWDD